MNAMRAARALSIAMLLAAPPATAAAQRGGTLGDMLDASQRAARQADLAARDPSAQRVLDSLVTVLRNLHATDLPMSDLRDVTAGNDPGLLVIARWRSNRFGIGGSAEVADAVRGVRQIVNTRVAPLLRLSPAAEDSLLAPLNEFSALVRSAADSLDQERLRQFEMKYGPGSPRLNGAEVLANYLGQLVLSCRRFYPLPCFGVTPRGMPSPYELVVTYRSTDLTRSDTGGADGTKLRLVSTGQMGLRIYDFAAGSGDGGAIARLVRPRQVALGLFALAPRDAPLQNPLARGRRLGGFVDWGGLHAAYTAGDRRRLVIGTGTQILRYLF